MNKMYKMNLNINQNKERFLVVVLLSEEKGKHCTTVIL